MTTTWIVISIVAILAIIFVGFAIWQIARVAKNMFSDVPKTVIKESFKMAKEHLNKKKTE